MEKNSDELLTWLRIFSLRLKQHQPMTPFPIPVHPVLYFHHLARCMRKPWAACERNAVRSTSTENDGALCLEPAGDTETRNCDV